MGRMVEGPDGPIMIGARRLPEADGKFRVTLGARDVVVSAEVLRDGGLRIQLPDGRELRAAVTVSRGTSWVSVVGVTTRVAGVDRSAAPPPEGSLEAPMPGKILQLRVAVGDQVEPGDVVLILEAMKMEHALKAPHSGTVVALAAGEGDMVNPGTTLVTIEA